MLVGINESLCKQFVPYVHVNITSLLQCIFILLGPTFQTFFWFVMCHVFLPNSTGKECVMPDLSKDGLPKLEANEIT